MEKLYLTKLEQSIKDGNYHDTMHVYSQPNVSFFPHNSKEYKNSKYYKKNKGYGGYVFHMPENIYSITYQVVIEKNNILPEHIIKDYIEDVLGLEESDHNHILKDFMIRNIDITFNIMHREQINHMTGHIVDIYSINYYLIESEIEKIKENVFIKEKEIEKQDLLDIMNVNEITTTKKRGRL